MPKTLTVARATDTDVIKVPLWIINPATGAAQQFMADLDTGNDHTCIHPRTLQQIGLVPNGRHLPVHGVAGSSVAQVATVSLGMHMDNGHQITVSSHQVAVLDSINCDILMGRDFLQWCDVSLRRGGTTTLTFD